MKLLFTILFCSFCVDATTQIPAVPMFTLMNEKETGISFLNKIQEDDSLNVLRYEYLYNGGGVGAGDFNNDGLTDIFFSGNMVRNKLFLNRGNFKFEDISKAAGIQGNGTWGTGVCVADVNGDNLLDIYVCHSGKYDEAAKLSNELFINKGIKNGVPEFKEEAQLYGLDLPGTQSTQAAFFDYDKDGDLDMFLLNHSNHTYNALLNTRKIRATPDMRFGNRLLRNDIDAKGVMHFTDVTLQSGIVNNAINFGLGLSIADVNKDGWPDIYTTSDYTEQDYFYLNNHDGSFSESLKTSFSHISKFSMGCDIVDYNNDALPDVITLDMLPEDNHRQKLLKGADEYDQYHLLIDSGYYDQQMRNMLQLNRGEDDKGNTRFSEIGQLSGISNTDWSWSPLVADFDNDGWKDMYITNGYLRDYTDLDFLKYTVAEAKLDEAAKGNLDFKTFSLVKKMPSNKISNYMFQNNADLTYKNVTVNWGLNLPSISNSAIYADLDNDGDIDMVVYNNNEPAFVYRNNLNGIINKHFLDVTLKGKEYNSQALGSKIYVYKNGTAQYQELFPVRGFQSSSTAKIHFGLGDNTTIDSLVVIWPDDKKTILTNVGIDKGLICKQEDAIEKQVYNKEKKEKLFEDITESSGFNYKHEENDFIDFKSEVLLPYQLSKMGPALAKADVDGDGREDVFVGGAVDRAGKLFLQTAQAKFTESSTMPWNADKASEDVNAIFFDADNDGDADLYVVSGGNEYEENAPEYQDRIYVNDGKGNFSKTPSAALPQMLSNKQAVAVSDFDHDGDMDLFVGGRAVPGSFPLPAASYILRNDSKNGEIKFSDVTDEVAPALRKPGMVTCAAWVDFNHDGFPELIIAGDWMPLKIYNNEKGKLSDISSLKGLNFTEGMWSSIKADDIDNDGDTDLVVGNCGLNNQFKADSAEPMSIYVSDFDDNGVVDPILCYYIQGKSYPLASRDELLDEILPLRKKYNRYKQYADASINDIFSKEQIQKTYKVYCHMLASIIIINNGNNHFTIRQLPLQAQFSNIYGIVTDDIDKDGIKDIIATGNFFPNKVQLGKNDASFGTFLKGTTTHDFKVVTSEDCNLFAGGDIRNMIELNINTPYRILVLAKNNGEVQLIKINDKNK